MRLYSIFITLLLLPLCSSAAIYKWTDAKGNVHYSQQKPKQASSLNRLKINSRAPDNSSSYKSPAKKQDKETTADTEKDKPQKLSPKKKARLCASAKRNLQTLTARAQIKQRDKKGNVRFITDKEKRQRVKQASEFMRKNCR